MERPLNNTALSRLYRYLCSTETAIFLFLAICILALPGTFGESRRIYSSPPFLALLALLWVSTLACTVKRIRSLHYSVLFVHGGVLLLLAGAMVSSLGFVATVNIYEGTGVDTAYRWDKGAEMPLGMELRVRKIHTEYYPAPVKVGVLRGAEKIALLTLNTGESFDIGDYSVTAVDLDPQARNLGLAVYRQGRFIGSADTSGRRELPLDFPYDFRLVAFKDRVLKRMRVDLQLLRESRAIAEGSSEVNSPFQWGGLYFFHVQSGRDPGGRAYAGIQIVRDPGKPLVFSGFVIVALGVVFSFARRFYGRARGH
jgi:hypothetical protein